MAKIIIELSMSLDGFIAGPNDGGKYPLGERGGEHVFDWYQGGTTPIHGDERFNPEGANREVVEEMFRTAGAMLTGRRTYEIAQGWKGTHPVNGIPVIVLTHKPPANVPKGASTFIFVTDGIVSAVEKAKAAAGDKHVGIGGASAAQQALAAGLVDEIYLHVAPILLGDGVRLFEHLGDSSIRLERMSVQEAPKVTHLRYRVVQAE
jgi:dihydrofolate reductase